MARLYHFLPTGSPSLSPPSSRAAGHFAHQGPLSCAFIYIARLARMQFRRAIGQLSATPAPLPANSRTALVASAATGAAR